jgi:dTDP-4-dehydrorhamnose reductase
MKLLVTGADGLLGKSCLELAKGEHEVTGLDIDSLDITNVDAVQSCLSDLKPQAVLHCAAYTNVDGAEAERQKAWNVNARGAEWVARAAREIGALMVYVSTDYVFDGKAASPYRESHPPHPLSAYGASKLGGEQRVSEACPEKHLIVRTAWLYGSGKGFVDWVCSGLETQEELTLVHDHKGSPTFAVDLAGALLRLTEQDRRGIFHYSNKGETSWYQWGQTIASMMGLRQDCLKAISADELGRAAPRPAYSVMAVDKYEEATGDSVPSWQNALERYLRSRERIT